MPNIGCDLDGRNTDMKRWHNRSFFFKSGSTVRWFHLLYRGADWTLQQFTGT